MSAVEKRGNEEVVLEEDEVQTKKIRFADDEVEVVHEDSDHEHEDSSTDSDRSEMGEDEYVEYLQSRGYRLEDLAGVLEDRAMRLAERYPARHAHEDARAEYADDEESDDECRAPDPSMLVGLSDEDIAFIIEERRIDYEMRRSQLRWELDKAFENLKNLF